MYTILYIVRSMTQITSAFGHAPASFAHRRRAGVYFNGAQCARELATLDLNGVVTTTVENIVYLTGYDHWPLRTFRDHGVYAVVNADGRRGLVAPLNAGEYLATAELEDCFLVTYGDFFVTLSPDGELSDLDRHWQSMRTGVPHFPDALAALDAVVAEAGLGSGERLAVDGRGIDLATLRRLGDRYPFVADVDGNAVLQRVRRIKTPDEVTLLADVARRTECAMESVFRSAEIGSSETDLWTHYQHACIDAGIVPGHCEVNIGGRASGCFPPDGEVRVQHGDTIRIDCGGRFAGYSSDTGRNACIGPMSPRIKLAEKAIHAGITAMFEMAAPGVRVVDLVARGLETVRANGISDFRRHHLGHGIGLDMYEFPVLSPTQSPDVVLVEGEVLNFEVPFYEMGTGGLQIEDTVLVTNTGVEVLTTCDRLAFSI
ncbi:Xaa-Pro dipeptidase [Mycolicibacterium sp. 624]